MPECLLRYCVFFSRIPDSVSIKRILQMIFGKLTTMFTISEKKNNVFLCYLKML
ncbi:unnamed protein product, partial [Schistosoma intercalatum]